MTKLFKPSRRAFTLAAGATLFGASTGGLAWGQDGAGQRSITNYLGTYDVPTDPKRVIAIDERIDLETALALQLPVIAYSHQPKQPWVTAETDAQYIAFPPNLEEILGLEPDLILCSDWGDTDGWPLQKLRAIAPVLPLDASIGWRANLANISGWLGMEGRADAVVADFDATVKAIHDRHASVVESKKVVALHYLIEEGMVMIRGKGSNHADVLKDIGGHTIDPSIIEEGTVSMEQLPEMLAGFDGILYAELFDEGTYEAVQQNPLWARIPAVAAGKVHVVRGSTNFGGVYSAKFLASEWEKLFALLEA